MLLTCTFMTWLYLHFYATYHHWFVHVYHFVQLYKYISYISCISTYFPLTVLSHIYSCIFFLPLYYIYILLCFCTSCLWVSHITHKFVVSFIHYHFIYKLAFMSCFMYNNDIQFDRVILCTSLHLELYFIIHITFTMFYFIITYIVLYYHNVIVFVWIALWCSHPMKYLTSSRLSTCVRTF